MNTGKILSVQFLLFAENNEVKKTDTNHLLSQFPLLTNKSVFLFAVRIMGET